MIFVLVILAAITTIWVATLGLSSHTLIYQTRASDDLLSQQAFAGALANLRDGLANSKVSVPSSYSYTDPSTKRIVQITVVDNSGSIARTVLAAIRVDMRSRTYIDSEVVGIPRIAKPNDYLLAANKSFNGGSPLLTGAGMVNGDLYANGDLHATDPTNDIEGDVEATGMLACAGTVNGTQWANAPPINFPVIPSAAYTLIGNVNASSTAKNIDFTSNSGETKIFIGNLTIEGTITGIGSIVVVGNLTITNNLTYANAASHVAIIVSGNVTAIPTVATFVGYYYVGGNFTAKGPSSINLALGSIAADSITMNPAFQGMYDPYIYNNPANAKALRVPGYWP